MGATRTASPQTPDIKDSAAKFKAAMKAFTTSQMRRQVSPTQQTVMPKGEFKNSLLNAELLEVKKKLDDLKTKQPALAGDCDNIFKTLETTLTAQHGQLLAGFSFDQTRWDNNFNLNDPNNQLKTPLNNIQTATVNTTQHQDLMDAIDNIQKVAIANELGRLSESVQRQKTSADITATAKQVYGSDSKKVWERIDNPVPDADFENASISGISIGRGQNGLYHREGSQFNINLVNDVATPINTKASWYQNKFHSTEDFKAGVREAIESLIVLGGANKVTFDFPEVSAQQFGKQHFKNMRNALGEARALVEEAIKNGGNGPFADFDFGQKANDLLSQTGKISGSDKQKLEKEMQEFKSLYQQASGLKAQVTAAQQAAATPPPVTPGAQATPATATPTPIGAVSNPAAANPVVPPPSPLGGISNPNAQPAVQPTPAVGAVSNPNPDAEPPSPPPRMGSP